MTQRHRHLNFLLILFHQHGSESFHHSLQRFENGRHPLHQLISCCHGCIIQGICSTSSRPHGKRREPRTQCIIPKLEKDCAGPIRSGPNTSRISCSSNGFDLKACIVTSVFLSALYLCLTFSLFVFFFLKGCYFDCVQKWIKSQYQSDPPFAFQDYSSLLLRCLWWI